MQDRRRATAHWKLRILDLLELFMKREPRSELLLLLPQPLLECVQAPSVFKVREPRYSHSSHFCLWLQTMISLR